MECSSSESASEGMSQNCELAHLDFEIHGNVQGNFLFFQCSVENSWSKKN